MEKNQSTASEVIVCLDGSSLSQAVLAYGQWFATQHHKPVRLFHRLEPVESVPVDLSGAIGLGASEDLLNDLAQAEGHRSRLLLQKSHMMLQAAKNTLEATGVSVVEDQAHGHLVEDLIRLENQPQSLDDSPLIVVGIRGERHETSSQGLGGQLETMIRALHQPICVVNTSFTEPKSLLLAYDSSEHCQKAVQALKACTLVSPMECHLVHVADKPGADQPKGFDETATELKAAGFAVKASILSGDKIEALIQYQRQQSTDLLVMGAFSHHPMRDFLLGSFTMQILNQTQKPLLLFR